MDQQNANRREEELYRRSLRQLGRRSRRGDTDAGLAALDLLDRASARGIDPTGISSYEANRDIAVGDLERQQQLADAMTGAGGQYNPPPGAEPYNPPSEETESLDVTNLATELSPLDRELLAEGYRVRSKGGTPRMGLESSSRMPDFQASPRPSEVPPLMDLPLAKAGPSPTPLPPGERPPGFARMPRPGERTRGTINGIPTDTVLDLYRSGRSPGSVVAQGPPKPSFEQTFSRDYPATTAFLQQFDKLNYDPQDPAVATDEDFQNYLDRKDRYGRSEALRMSGEESRLRLRDSAEADREMRYRKKASGIGSVLDTVVIGTRSKKTIL